MNQSLFPPGRRRPSAFPTLVLGLLLGVASGSTSAAPQPDLTGVVRTSAGQFVTNASVFIYTAGPRLGPGILCPSCYADCRKSTQSGAGGEFKIEALDPDLLFQVLVVAPGCVPTFFNKVDPLKSPLDAKLAPRTGTNTPPSQTILGRVVNAQGAPLSNVVVSVNSTTIGNRTSGRPPAGTDPLAITDERGEFKLQSEGQFDAMNLQIDARGYAKLNVPDVRPGPKRREFTATLGAALSGRVLLGGKPLKDVTVGVAGVDRSMGNFVGDFVINTMENGKFLFANLPPNRDYALYLLMNSVRRFGALRVRTVRLTGDGSETDAGDLVLTPGLRLAGRVQLADGQPLPEHTRLLIGRREAWDTLTVELPPDGRFDLTHLPGETLSLDTRVPGYRFSNRNPSLDQLNPFQLIGRLSADKTNLTVLLEPGQEMRGEFSPIPDEERPENLPLCGIEGKRVIPGAVTFSGHVLDAETKAALPAFRVTPGLQRIPTMKDWIEWYKSKSVEGTNGEFSLDVALKEGAIVILAEAEGYVPAISGPLKTSLTTCDIRLRKGTGPHGRLVLPEGKPADGVSVFYLTGREQASLDEKGKITMFQDRERSETITDPDGEFQFAPKLGAGEVFAANAHGFARASTAELAANGKLALQPWARAGGRLVQGGRPVAGENLDLSWRSRNFTGAQPWFNLPGTRTDEDGRFLLEKVPAGELQITTRTRIGSDAAGPWTSQTQHKFVAKPGENINLGEIEKTAPTAANRGFPR